MQFDALFPLLIVGAFFSVIIAINIWGRQHDRGTIKRLDDIALTHGWKFTGGEGMYYLRGKESGINWVIEGGARGTDSASTIFRYTRIASEDVRADNPVAILITVRGESPTADESLDGKVTGVMEQILRNRLWTFPGGGPGLVFDSQKLKFVSVGSEEFLKTYSVLAETEQDARKLLTPSIEQLLVEITHKPNSELKPLLVMLTKQGLSIQLSFEYTQANDLEKVVALCTSMVHSIQKQV